MRPAEHGAGAGEDQARPAREGAHRVQEMPGAVEIDGVAQVDVGLGGTADHGRQMVDRVVAGAEEVEDDARAGDVAGQQLQARVRGQALGRGDVEQGDALDPAAEQLAALQQPCRQLLADETAAARDQHAHGRDLPVAELREALSDRGRVGQPEMEP